MPTWTNADGLKVRFNAEEVENKTGNQYVGGPIRSLVIDMAYNNLPTSSNAVDERNGYLPANAYIVQAFLLVDDPFTSGGATTLDIGLIDKDNNVISATAVDAAIAKTAIDGANEVVVCDGAYVRGVLNIGPKNAFVYTTVGTGPYTAGHAKLVIHYITDSL